MRANLNGLKYGSSRHPNSTDQHRDFVEFRTYPKFTIEKSTRLDNIAKLNVNQKSQTCPISIESHKTKQHHKPLYVTGPKPQKRLTLTTLQPKQKIGVLNWLQ